MPRRSGTEVYRLIRSRNPRLPILLCSGYSREAVPASQDPDEPRVFLPKPFTYALLAATLRDLMGNPA